MRFKSLLFRSLTFLAGGSIILFFMFCENSERLTEQKMETAALKCGDLTSFKKFLNKVQVLPQSKNIFSLEFEPDSLLLDFDRDSEDTLFVKNKIGAGKLFGLLPDTSRFYHLLWYALVENGALMLTTLNKCGTVLDEKCLSTDLYGCGCGYNWHGSIYLLKGPAFLLRDSLITFECDSGIAPESEWKHEIATQTVSVLNDGKILFSKLNMVTVKDKLHPKSNNN